MQGKESEGRYGTKEHLQLGRNKKKGVDDRVEGEGTLMCGTSWLEYNNESNR